MNFLLNSPFESISKSILLLREQKGREEDALSWIDKAISFGKGFVANLYFERILVFQHLVMGEDSKPDGKRDVKKKNEALANMEAATLVAQKYVTENKLKSWKSRTYRFLGRLYDYKGKFLKSIEAYKKAIPLAKFDPEFVEKRVPRQLELEAFLSFSLIMSGQTKKGLDLAQMTFKKFNDSKDGESLKSMDYFTWAVWKSGIPIRTIGALQSKKISFDKKKLLSWLKEVESDLNPPKSKKFPGDFTLRRDEIEALKRRLQRS